MSYRRFFASMLSLVLLGSLAALLAPALIQLWMRDDNGLSRQRIIVLLSVLILSLGVELVLIYFRERFAEGFNIANAKALFEDYLHLSYDELNEQGPTNLVERLAIAVNSFYTYYTGDSIRLWSSSIVMLAVLAMLGWQNWLLALALSMLIPLNYFGYRALNKELMQRSRVAQESTSSGWQEILSVTANVDYLKQSPDYQGVLRQFDAPLRKIYGSMAQVNVFAQLASRLLSSINQIVQVFVMAVIAYGFLQGETNPLSLVLSSIVLPLYFSHLSIITNSNLNKRDMRNSQALWDSWKEKREPSGEHTISAITEVAFDLPELKIKDRVLAHDIIGSYKKGDVVWVQGASGTGKSTLMKLLPKFRQSDGVYINGLDIREIDNRSLRSHLEYLSQQVPIIKGTLRDNLFFNREYSQAVEEQMKDDPVLRSILAEKTMDTVIQEGGSNLSGGEKQKIAIARTLYDQVDVMILDEIASNIDKQSATEIYQRILQNKDDRITFIISHDYLPEHYANKVLPLAIRARSTGTG